MGLPGWEAAEVYLQQFLDALNAKEIESNTRSRFDGVDHYYSDIFILIQDVVDWPLLDDRYDLFGFDRSDEDINPKSKRA